jgi:hypothetical protein
VQFVFVRKEGLARVETKIFVFVFSQKKLTKSYENNENFRENQNV